MSYIVNSYPATGLRHEPSALLANAVDALLWAGGLDRRGMRLVRIVDTQSGKSYEAAALRGAQSGAGSVVRTYAGGRGATNRSNWLRSRTTSACR
jgi:hypothetical protein